MKIKLIFVLLFLYSIFSGDGSAQVRITDHIFLDAEFRPRLEFDRRDFSSNGYDSYATFRTRIGLSLENIVENTMLYIQIADSRLMGFSDPYLTGWNTGPNKWDNNLGVTKVFIEVHDLFGKGTYLRIGRMSNDQGRNRIFGPGNWNIYGPRTYDGLKIGYKNDQFFWNIWNFWGIAGDRHWNFNPDAPGKYADQTIPYKLDHTLTGFDLSLAKGVLNLLGYLDLDQKPVVDTLRHETNIAFSRIILATNVKWRQNKTYGLWLDFDVAFQFGHQAYDAGNGDIKASLIAGDASYRFQGKHKPWLGFGFDLISGDDGDSPEKINNFYEFYYSKHSFQGDMDLFTEVSGIKTFGLRAFILRTGIELHKNLTAKIDFHHFRTEKPFLSSTNQAKGKKLGQELDLTIDYFIRTGLKVRFGLDQFWPSHSWQGQHSQKSIFSYLTLTASF